MHLFCSGHVSLFLQLQLVVLVTCGWLFLIMRVLCFEIIKSFNHKKYSNETELSKYVWHLKENNTDYTIKWSIIKNSISYTGGSKRCNLCLEEKLSILKEKSKYLLNKRSEIVSACHHKNKFQVNHLTKKGMHGI